MSNWKLGGVVVAVIAAGVYGWWQFGDSLRTPGSTANSGTAQQASGAAKTDKPAGRSAQSGKGAGNAGRGRGRPPALVVAQPVSQALINDRLKAVGSGMAKASVSVVPFSGGLLTEVLVSSGQTVEKNAVLARLDDEEELIARDRATQAVENASVDEARLATLFRSRSASEADLIRARAELADASLALRDAELTLARRSIKAPIGGIVGLVAVDEGNYVTTQSEIVTIDDRSTIVLEFWVPERFSSQITVGQRIEATSQANPAKPHIGTITGIGSRIETDSRTLPVQAELTNSDDRLRPGMAFNISLSFAGQTYPAVDPLAIQWDSKGSFVWVVANEKVQRVPVQIIQRNPESVLVAGELPDDANIVTEGLMALRPGATVRLQGGNPTSGQGKGNGKPGAGKPEGINKTNDPKSGKKKEAAQL